MKTYKTIRHESEGFYKEKGSKFYSFAFPVSDEKDVDKCLKSLRTKFHEARHHCYAYVIGDNMDSMKANDDGEPSHSAGDPILGQIRSFGLTYTLVVVIRYFGGTKLGVGGLIHAYKTATSDSLSKNKIKEIIITKPLTIKYPYDSTSEVLRIVDEFDLKIINQTFDLECSISGSVPIHLIELLTSKAKTLNDMGIKFDLIIQD